MAIPLQHTIHCFIFAWSHVYYFVAAGVGEHHPFGVWWSILWGDQRMGWPRRGTRWGPTGYAHNMFLWTRVSHFKLALLPLTVLTKLYWIIFFSHTTTLTGEALQGSIPTRQVLKLAPTVQITCHSVKTTSAVSYIITATKEYLTATYTIMHCL